MLLLIEFNELCPTLLARFMNRGMLPHFRGFYETSTVWTTDAGEAPPNLEPWIQWPTVHAGLPFAEHQVFHLGDGRKLPSKCLAEVLSDAGIPVGVCASMNLNYRQLNGYVLPDPWDADGQCQPSWLAPFYRTVARQVQESSRNEGLSVSELVRFGWFMLRNGLTAATVRALAGQLLAERFEPGVRWRRACLLDRLLYDVFRSLNRRFGVRFASFFCNSTAHFQHYYWRNMEPERFAVPVPARDHPSLGQAIALGYQALDALLGRIMHDYPDALLVLCSALSQQPWAETTKCTYRPTQFEKLLKFARVPAAALRVKPVMAEEFHLECAGAPAAELAEARLQELTLAGAPLLRLQRNGSNLFAACRLNDAVAPEQQVVRGSDGARLPFAELFHMVHGMRSGRHHPDGVFWVRNGSHRVLAEKLPLTCVAPSLLQYFGVRAPASMRGTPVELRGTREFGKRGRTQEAGTMEGAAPISSK